MESRVIGEHGTESRIELELHAQASTRQHLELGAFVRFCVNRIERELGASEHWIVQVGPAAGRFQSTITVHDSVSAVRSTGDGIDAPLAVWDALSRLEQVLRDARAGCRLRTQPPAARFDRG